MPTSTAVRRGVRYSVVAERIERGGANGLMPSYVHRDEAPDAPVSVRIADHDSGASYVVSVIDLGDKRPPELRSIWRMPLRKADSFDAIAWMSEAELATTATLFLRRWEAWQLANAASPGVAAGWLDYAEQTLDLAGEPTPAEIATQVRIARARGIPIYDFFTSTCGHPWAWSRRTAARRIAQAKQAGLLPEETGARGRGARTTKTGAEK